MKELTRFEIAICKRTAQNTKSLRTKRDKLVVKINTEQAELESINAMIERFEQPIKEMTGGFTSEEVLNGTMDSFVESVTTETPQIQPEEEGADFPFNSVEENKEEVVMDTEEFNV